MSKNSNGYDMQEVTKLLQPKEILDMSHRSTILHQILSLVPRREFVILERKHITGRKPRTFTLWSQFAALAFIQLSARRSMRDGLRNLEVAGKRLYHLGMRRVARSTFSDANNTRPAEFFKDLFGEMYRRCRPHAPSHKFRFKSKLLSIDATTIKLCLTLFPWASFRKKRGGIKLHTVLDHDGCIPSFVCMTEACVHDSKIAKTLDLPTGSIVTFDKAYNDYVWFQALNAKGVFFVTRLKKNASYRLVKRQKVNRKTGVTSDHIIELSGRSGKLKLRRIGYRDPETGNRYEFLTNHFRLVAKTIADIYKERWKIELFFKEIKQNLKIKTFVGNSENAVLTQVYVALVVYLLVAYHKFISRLGMSVQQMLQLFQVNLLGRLSLEELFNPRKRKTNISHDLRLLELIS
jgi:hypothetical protein